jgi:hypothetical protein
MSSRWLFLSVLGAAALHAPVLRFDWLRSLKRRLVTASLLLRPVHRMSARETAEAFAIVAAVHVPINVIGHVLGVRSSSL